MGKNYKRIVRSDRDHDIKDGELQDPKHGKCVKDGEGFFLHGNNDFNE